MNPRLVGILIGVVGAFLFAGKAIIVKLAYRYGADSTSLLGLRMAFAAPLFLGVALAVDVYGKGKRAEWKPGDRWRIAFLGFIGYYLSSYLDFLGLKHVTAGLERIILYLSPTIVLLISRFWFGRSVRPLQWIALGVSYVGVMLVFLVDLRDYGASSNIPLGGALVLASACTYSLYLIGAGEVVPRLGSLRLTAWASLVASVCCIVQAFVIGGATIFRQAPEVYGLSVINAVFSTFIPIFLIMMSVERLGSGTAAQIGMVGPAATILLGAWFLDEAITVPQVAGTAIVVAGVLLLSRAARKPAADPQGEGSATIAGASRSDSIEGRR